MLTPLQHMARNPSEGFIGNSQLLNAHFLCGYLQNGGPSADSTFDGEFRVPYVSEREWEGMKWQKLKKQLI
jgi:hypothetical protein